jgi:hypothetical protein
MKRFQDQLACCTPKTYASRTTMCAANTRLWPHALYVNLAVRRDCSSPAARALRQPRRAPRLLVSGRTRSTSTSPCATTTRLRPHGLYVDLVVRCDYSSPAARALRQPRRAPRVLVLTLPAAAIYLDSATRPGASARRAARRVARRAARRRLPRLCRMSGCLGTSRGSSSTTSPLPRVRVPRHVARLVTRLVAPLVVDYFASAARPGASARRAARHVASRATLRRLLRVAQSCR